MSKTGAELKTKRFFCFAEIVVSLRIQFSINDALKSRAPVARILRGVPGLLSVFPSQITCSVRAWARFQSHSISSLVRG
jgi:hypothetical protein